MLLAESENEDGLGNSEEDFENNKEETKNILIESKKGGWICHVSDFFTAE